MIFLINITLSFEVLSVSPIGIKKFHNSWWGKMLVISKRIILILN